MRHALAIAFIACAASRAAAQAPDPADYVNRDDFSSEALFATGIVTNGARATGLGGAYTAVADDISALVYNPAGLAQVRRIEVALGMRHQRDTATFDMFGAAARATTAATGLDEVGFAFPVPTYRGSLVLGGAITRARSNDLESARVDRRSGSGFVFDDEFLRQQSGGLWRFAGGLGVDLLPELSLGGGIAYWHGSLEDDQFRRLDEQVSGRPRLRAVDRLRTDATVDGFGFDLGLMGYVGGGGRIGLALRSPVWLDISGDGELSLDDLDDGQPPEVQFLLIDQKPRLPWSVSAGASWSFGPALVAADLGYTAWDELDLDDAAAGDPPRVDTDYDAGVAVHTGIEVAPTSLPLRLRGGYSFQPLEYELLLGNPAHVERDRHVVTAGAGVLVAGVFALDVGAAFTRFERTDRDFAAVSEEHEDRRVVLTAAYRY